MEYLRPDHLLVAEEPSSIACPVAHSPIEIEPGDLKDVNLPDEPYDEEEEVTVSALSLPNEIDLTIDS